MDGLSLLVCSFVRVEITPPMRFYDCGAMTNAGTNAG